jgi:hypothetical protein
MTKYNTINNNSSSRYNINKYDIETKHIGIYKCSSTKLFYYTYLSDNDKYKSKLYNSIDKCLLEYNKNLNKKNKRVIKVRKLLNICSNPVKKNFKQKSNSNIFQVNTIKRFKIHDYIKNILYSRQNDLCNLCKNNLGVNRIVDHVVPLFLGGEDNINNYQALCGHCNKWKTYNFDHYIKKNCQGINTTKILEIQFVKYNEFFRNLDAEESDIDESNTDNEELEDNVNLQDKPSSSIFSSLFKLLTFS